MGYKYNPFTNNLDLVETGDSFDISVNFIDIEQFVYVAPEDFQIDSIENPSALTLTVKVNTVAYTLGTTISKFDDLTIDTDGVGFIILNCSR